METMTERKPPGMSFETWVDTQITRSMARGISSVWPVRASRSRTATGRRPATSGSLAKARRKENWTPAAMLPPGLALRKEREGLPARAERLTSEAEVRALAEDYNARVQAFWRRPQESRWSPLPGLAEVESLVEWWYRNRPPAPPAPAAPAPPRRRPRWFRRRVH